MRMLFTIHQAQKNQKRGGFYFSSLVQKAKPVFCSSSIYLLRSGNSEDILTLKKGVCAYFVPPERLVFHRQSTAGGEKRLKRFAYKIYTILLKSECLWCSLLPLGFRPRVQLSKFFSAVRMGGKQFKHHSWRRLTSSRLQETDI